ncbi:transposable element Tc3 transposase [Trichonephila clavipes]|nr:transposable element Tc3 transposase [Trichonephila clavipes]
MRELKGGMDIHLLSTLCYSSSLLKVGVMDMLVESNTVPNIIGERSRENGGHDEVEKLAYQLNEEAERTERPIRRLSKVMYGSTCADMQVDVMGECLSSIKHVVGTTSGCFYPRSNHWEVGGRPQCDKCGCRVRNCSQHRFTTLETISNYRNSYPGFSSGRPHPQMTGTLSYRPEETGGRQREKSLDTGDWTTDIAFYRGQKTARWWSVCTTPCTVCTFNACPSEKAFSVIPEHRNWRDNEWGRVLFTDESRFSLSSDSHRILIWREREAAIIPRTSLKGTGSVNGTRYCNEILLPYVRLFRGAMGLQFLFMDDNAPCHRTVAAEQFLESEDIERMDWPARSPDLNPIEHVWDFPGRRLVARTLPPVTIREL